MAAHSVERVRHLEAAKASVDYACHMLPTHACSQVMPGQKGNARQAGSAQCIQTVAAIL